MNGKSPLTRDIGRTERTLQALIHRELEPAGMTFPEWAALALLAAAGPMTEPELGRRLVDDRITTAEEAHAVTTTMRARNLIGPELSRPEEQDPPLAITGHGAAVQLPVREAIGGITAQLFSEIDPNDLETTRRTLTEVTRRANELLQA